MNENANFAIDVAFLLGLIFFISRMAYLRSKREVLIKKGSTRHEVVEKMLSTRRLVIAIFITALVSLKTIFDVRSILRIYGDSAVDQLWFAFTFSAVLCSVIFLLIYYLFRKSNLIIRP